MISAKEAAEKLGVSVQRISQLVRADLLRGEKHASVWFIEEASVEERLKSVQKRGGRPAKGSSKFEVRYTLMNRTYEVARLVYDTRAHVFTMLGDFCDIERGPIGVLTRETAPSLADFNDWWRGRGIPGARSGLVDLLRDEGVSIPEELIMRNLGLSLSDQYWIKPHSSELEWKDINFFGNRFRDVASRIDGGSTHENNEKASGSEGEDAPAHASRTGRRAHPNNTSDGNLPKWWEERGRKRVLLKGSGTLAQEPYNELVATALHARMLRRKDYAPYTLEERDGASVSVCENFLKDTEEYIPAYYVDRFLKEHESEDSYHHYLRCCEALGAASKAELALWKQIVCDDILANSDRHWRNFGLVRNVKSGAIRPAPIFDSGTSLWCTTSLKDLEAGEFGFSSKQFDSSPARQMMFVEDMSWFEAEALDGFVEEVMDILAANDMLEERLPYIRRNLERRVFRIRDLREWS